MPIWCKLWWPSQQNFFCNGSALDCVLAVLLGLHMQCNINISPASQFPLTSYVFPWTLAHASVSAHYTISGHCRRHHFDSSCMQRVKQGVACKDSCNNSVRKQTVTGCLCHCRHTRRQQERQGQSARQTTAPRASCSLLALYWLVLSCVPSSLQP